VKKPTSGVAQESAMIAPNPRNDDLAAARDSGVIDAETFARLTAFLSQRESAAPNAPPHPAPRYDVVNLLWYAGALIVLGAMGLFSTQAFGLWGERALLATSLAYAAVFTLAGAYLWKKRDLRTPGGLLITCAVGMAPLFIFALQSLWGHSPVDAPASYKDFYVWIKSSWLPMETGTILAALIALVFFPFPFLVMVISFSLWFMSMDLTPWLLEVEEFSWDQRAKISMAFGLVMLALAWLVDLKRWKNGDFAFWLHLFGLMAFWGGLTQQHSGDEFGKAVYCAINAGLIFLSLFLMRRAYAVFGGIGVTLYLGHLADTVFKDSILFPFALSGIGVLFIVFGLLFHRHGGAIGESLSELLPEHLKGFRPAHAREEG
jgi:hypothetical protein